MLRNDVLGESFCPQLCFHFTEPRSYQLVLIDLPQWPRMSPGNSSRDVGETKEITAVGRAAPFQLDIFIFQHDAHCHAMKQVFETR